MRLLILVLLACTSLQAFADCKPVIDDLLKRESLIEKTAGVQHKDIDMDSKKIADRRDYLVSNAIYTYKPDPKYGDIFNLPEDVDSFIQDKKHFTVIHEYSKGSSKLRVFDNQKTKTIQGFSYELNKRKEIFSFNQDCSMNEVTVMLDGARCYLKKQECGEFTPVTASKLQKKCSYFGDFSEKSLTAFEKACEIMTTRAGVSSPSVAPATEHKATSPAVR